MKVNSKTCAWKDCDNTFTPRFRTTEKYCSRSCTYQAKFHKYKGKPVAKKKINHRTPKRMAQERQYHRDRMEYLRKPQNRFCFIHGCTARATTIEHTKGREGYADDWAWDNDVPLLLDQRHWQPCCWNHNLELERNPILSKAFQGSRIHPGKKN